MHQPMIDIYDFLKLKILISDDRLYLVYKF